MGKDVIGKERRGRTVIVKVRKRDGWRCQKDIKPRSELK